MSRLSPEPERTPLRVILVGAAGSAALILDQLEAGGYESTWTRVDSETDFKRSLNDHEWDLILSDYQLPGFSAARALELVATTSAGTPVIIVAGRIGEQAVAGALRCGVMDYVSTDDLTTLAAQVRVSLDKAAARHGEQRSDSILAAAVEGYGLTVAGRVVSVNQALCELTGFSRDELIGSRAPFPFWPADMISEPGESHDATVASERGGRQLTLMRKGGARFEAEVTEREARNSDGTVSGYVTTIRDVSDRVRIDAERERERHDLQAAQLLAHVGSWDQELASQSTGRWSLELWRMLGLEPRSVAPPLEEFLDMVHPDDRQRVTNALEHSRSTGEAWDGEFRLIVADTHGLHVTFRNEFTPSGGNPPVRVLRTIQDITKRAQHEAEQAALARIAELVAQNAPPATVFSTVAEQVRALFEAHSGMVSRFDAANGVGMMLSAHSTAGPTPAGHSYRLDGTTASAQVFQTGEPALFDAHRDAGSDPAAKTMARDGITAGIAAPITVGGQVWGTLAIAFAGGAVPAGAEQRLSRFTDLVAMAIANAEAWETLSRQASTDPITGLANHRTFYDRLRSEVGRASRYHRELSVIVLDIDHFKQVNDTFGHQAGDTVLAEFAQRLAAHARESELVARIGGEEFAWLLPETDSDGAYQAAERLRRGIESSPFSGVGKITVSAGVCSGKRGLAGEDIVRFADQALYWAKDGGRNATFLYTPEALSLLSQQRRTPESFQAMSSVRALARAIDSKDSSTGEHSVRVAAFAERLALQLGWTKKRARQLYSCGLLHDVGKIGIPDEILLRPGALTTAEYDEVKLHAARGAQIAAEVLEHDQVTWIRGHHERWDGSGYPDHLAGDDIPEGAQLLAIADAWDVMTQSRTYKRPQTANDALADVKGQSGRQFAPSAVTALEQITAVGVPRGR